MGINYMKIYSHQLFNAKIGNKVKLSRDEKLEDRVLETKEEIPRNAELSIFELEENSAYNIHIKIPKKKKAKYDFKSYAELQIEGVSLEEMRDLCQKFNILYEKIK